MGCGQLTCDKHPFAVGFSLLKLMALGQLLLGTEEPLGGLLAGIQHLAGLDLAALLLPAHLLPPHCALGQGAVAQGFPPLALAHLHGALAHAAAPHQTALHLGLEVWREEVTGGRVVGLEGLPPAQSLPAWPLGPPAVGTAGALAPCAIAFLSVLPS